MKRNGFVWLARQYFNECLHILYWAFFKPYSFRKWLESIHLFLSKNRNPWERKEEFKGNKEMEKYAHQSWWILLILPTIFSFSLMIVNHVFVNRYLINELRPWQNVVPSLSAWYVQLLLIRFSPKKSTQFSFFCIYIFLSLSVVCYFNASSYSVEETIVSLLETPLVPSFIASVIGVMIAFAIHDNGLVSSISVGIMTIVLGNSILVTILIHLHGDDFTIPENISRMIFLLPLVALLITTFGLLRLCLWMIEFLWSIGLSSLRFIVAPNRLLQYLPQRFDEQVLLPLPFVDRLIFEAAREAPEQAHEIISYLLTSTNQRRVAIRTLISITTQTLQECQTAQDIAATEDALDWKATELPKKLGQILPVFQDIRRDVKCALESDGPYRQAELLKIPINKLQNLNSISTKIFSQCAQIWIDILTIEQTSLQLTTTHKIPTAYIAGNSLDPDRAETRFKGRQDLFNQIATLTMTKLPPTLLFYGGRRIGKTSTLKYLSQKMGSDIIPLFVDMQGLQAEDPRNFVLDFAQAIQTSAYKARNYTWPAIDDDAVQRDPFPALRRWFTEIENVVDRAKRILLCLDEFERLDRIFSPDQIQAPLYFFRSVLQHRQRWIPLFSGSTHPDNLQPHWNDCLINVESLHISYLSEAAARELIRQPVPDFPDIYTPAAVDRIIHLTRRHPFWVQTLCAAIVETLNQRPNPLEQTASAEDVDAALEVALERGRTTLNELWGKLSAAERDCCDRILHNEMITKTDRGAIRRLLNLEIIEKQDETYQFQMPLIEHFLKDKLLF